MTGQEQELPVMRKLLRKRLSYEHCYDGELVHANPDGPEAAELITELVEALETARDSAWHYFKCPAARHDDKCNCGCADARLALDAVLTKARASTGGDA